MHHQLHSIRIRYIRLLLIYSAAFLFILAIYNLHRGFYYLGWAEMVFICILALSIRFLETHYEIVSRAIVFCLFILVLLSSKLQIEKSGWGIALWYPIVIFGTCFLTDYMWGLAMALYTIAVNTLFLMKRGLLNDTELIFYWVQLVMTTILTFIFYFAFSETWRRYEEVLKCKAERDQLTGVYNRSKILELLELECEKSKRYGIPVCVLMIDLDNFKEINDTMGHVHGDEVLRQVARTIRDNIRRIDYCGRYGGDEFIVIAPNTNAEGALKLAERIRKRVEELNLGVTVSIGVARFNEEKSIKEFISKVDEALYTSKQKGKNTVSLVEC